MHSNITPVYIFESQTGVSLPWRKTMEEVLSSYHVSKINGCLACTHRILVLGPNIAHSCYTQT